MKKTVLISGVSSGIGKASAQLLLKNGFQVAGASRRTALVEDLETQYPDLFLNIMMDVTSVKSVESAVKKTISHFGSLNVLINNAGVGYLGKIETGVLSEWHKMFDVNVNGLLSLTHQCLPHLIKSKGHVINIDSVAGHEVYPEGVVYCATKHAVKAISVGLEKELKGRVKVTNISPGPVETEFVNHTTDVEKSAQMKDYFKDVLTAENVSDAIFYAINQADHIAINEITIRPFK